MRWEGDLVCAGIGELFYQTQEDFGREIAQQVLRVSVAQDPNSNQTLEKHVEDKTRNRAFLILYIVEAGADAVGFVVDVPQPARNLSLGKVRGLVEARAIKLSLSPRTDRSN